MAPRCRHLWCRSPAKTAGKGKGKPSAKKKNKRGTRSKAATERRINQGQAKRLASALDRAEEEEVGTPDSQGSAEARGRRVVVTYTAQEAAEKKAAQPPATEPEKGKKLRKRRRRRTNNPRVVLRSVPAERPIRLKSVQRSAVTLKSVTRPKRKAPRKLEGQALEQAADLARSLQAATEQWQQANFRKRVEIKQGLKSKLPRGSLATSFLQRAGLDEACSSCDNRRKASAITAKARAIRRFSAGQIHRRVAELTRPKPVAKEAITVEDEDEEEEESSEEPPPDPGHLRRRPFDPSSSSDFEDERRRSASRGADAPPAVAAA